MSVRLRKCQWDLCRTKIMTYYLSIVEICTKDRNALNHFKTWGHSRPSDEVSLSNSASLMVGSGIFGVFMILFPVSIGILSNHWQLLLKRHHSIMSDSCLLSFLHPSKSQLCLTFAATQAGAGSATHRKHKKTTAVQGTKWNGLGFEAKRL